MNRRTSYASIAIGLAVATFGTVAAAQPPVAKNVDLGKFRCRALLKMNGRNRDNAVIFLQGYVSGEKNQRLIRLDAIARSTDKIINYCIDHPEANALAVFTKNR